MNTNNSTAEISLTILSGLLIVAASVLLYFGKIDFAAATVMIGSALALFGGNLALKAPSPSQQELLQQLIDALQPPTPARPITSNAYIPPEIRASLGVPARTSAIQMPTPAASVTQQHTINTPMPMQVSVDFPVAGTAIQNTSIPIQFPTGGNPAFPDVQTQVIPSVSKP